MLSIIRRNIVYCFDLGVTEAREPHSHAKDDLMQQMHRSLCQSLLANIGAARLGKRCKGVKLRSWQNLVSKRCEFTRGGRRRNVDTRTQNTVEKSKAVKI